MINRDKHKTKVPSTECKTALLREGKMVENGCGVRDPSTHRKASVEDAVAVQQNGFGQCFLSE